MNSESGMLRVYRLDEEKKSDGLHVAIILFDVATIFRDVSIIKICEQDIVCMLQSFCFMLQQ